MDLTIPLILGAIVIACVLMYNTLVQRRNRVEEALGGISAYLKKRSDLIPNLVSTVSQFAKHEKSLLTELTELRSKIHGPIDDISKISDADSKMSSLLGKITVAVEAYPELTSNASYINLQQSLHEVEEQLSAARRNYNANVVRYNDAVRMLPTSLLAGAMGYTPKAVFRATEKEAELPDVNELFKTASN